jgi:multidrug resistance efflux pump
LIGLRFQTPYSKDARVIQHTIQLMPRLSEPTLVTAILVEPDVPVKKGQPLFQFDRRPYEDKVRQLEAQLAQAKQNVLILQADEDVFTHKLARTKSELEYAKWQQQLFQGLSQQGAGTEEDAQKWKAQMEMGEASVAEAAAELSRARLRYQSQIDGVNTAVAATEAELSLARFSR